MRRLLAKGERPLDWVGSAKRDFLAFPDTVQDELGNALGLAQFGGKHPKAKPWKGQGPGVFEIVANHAGDAYRTLYTVRFREIVYVLHAFQKSLPRGDERHGPTLRSSGSGSGSRSRIMRHAMAGRNRRAAAVDITRSSGNVFADLGYADAEERQTKLRLAYAINGVIDERRLTQAAAAKILGVNQPKVSALRNYRLGGFSVERLMSFLTTLDRDIEIVIRRKPRSRIAARISVVAA
jgi:phage-related protein/predicted XRE-type DNA-binding protein